MHIMNLTQHPATPEQIAAGVIDLPAGQAERHLRYEDLTPRLKNHARAMFFDARPGDGYLYHVLRDGSLLCRAKA